MIFAKREVITARGAALARRVGRVCDLGALGCAANLGELDVTPEVERAREQSRVFLLAARRCNEFQPPSGYLQFLFVPSLVLYAFAIEVGFKALALHASGAAPRGHDLEALFRGLSAQLQAQIITDKSATYPGSEPYFDRDLAMVADVFEVWRYIHEQHPVDTDLGFLQRLARAVEKALAAMT